MRQLCFGQLSFLKLCFQKIMDVLDSNLNCETKIRLQMELKLFDTLLSYTVNAHMAFANMIGMGPNGNNVYSLKQSSNVTHFKFCFLNYL